MSIAVVIITHGSAALQLLKTVEMILGQQTNVAWLDFFPGENTEILIQKATNKLKELDTTIGVLFLVDTWGGSPFNAASYISMNTDQINYEVISGVNIPMLTEIFMIRDDNILFTELIQIAVDAGRLGVKALKNAQKSTTVLQKANKEAILTNINTSKNSNHMIIALARIDDRLIHGQVVTRWTKNTKINRIIVINDEVAADIMRKKLLTQVVPPGITAHVVDIAKAIRVYENPQYANDRVMLLFTNPTDVLRVVQGGISLQTINIGGMAYSHGKTQINHAISVDKVDILAFKQLHQHGIQLEIRQVPSDSPLNMITLINKLDV